MANSVERLAQSFLKKSFNDCSEEELFNLTKRYPYFAPAQFLYLKKLEPLSESYQNQYQKAVLFYNDPVLFEYFIDEEDFETTFIPIVKKAPIIEEKIAPSPIPEKTLTETKIEQESTPLPNPIQPVTENIITFEPYHTVDYFASQGIKLSVEESSKDKFGKQLKSFTEWLKAMKRLPATQINQVQGAAEKQVESLAAHSVQTSDVVTEAMAEVWLHQGNKEKAIEIYRKLSLLNPSKNSYFAAKIELLKDSN